MRPIGPLVLTLTAVAALPLMAQQRDTTMKQPTMQAMPAPGMIHGSGSRSASGTIHIVGNMKGSQKIHFTSDFKVDPSTNLHAVLSSDMMAGMGSADIGPIKSAGDQLIDVPANVDVAGFATLLVYDTKYKMVVASTALPNAKGQAYGAGSDSSMKKAY